MGGAGGWGMKRVRTLFFSCFVYQQNFFCVSFSDFLFDEDFAFEAPSPAEPGFATAGFVNSLVFGFSRPKNFENEARPS